MGLGWQNGHSHCVQGEKINMRLCSQTAVANFQDCRGTAGLMLQVNICYRKLRLSDLVDFYD